VPIGVVCPSCGGKFSAPDTAVGRRFKCPKCGGPLSVAAPLPQSSSPTPALIDHVVASWPVVVNPPPVVYVPPPQPVRPPADTKDCPFCGEEVLAVAKKCKHCGETIDVTLRAAEEARRAAERASQGPIVVVNTGRSRRRAKWSPGTAAVLSLVIPGAGQMYKGQVLNGLVWLVLVVIGYMALLVPGLILHVCCILGAASGDPRA
jgi:predicted RNA-binding Zn-ribbon protein involved in translation (DUF1610 family)